MTSARRTHELAPVIVGVDPGGKDTGIVIRRSDTLLWADTERRGPDEPISHYALRVRDSLDAAIAEAATENSGQGMVAVEDVSVPSPHMGLTNVRGLLDTAIVIGVLLGRHPLILVPPGKHGKGLLYAYPRPLQPENGRGRGYDRMRHCRSAWDVAGAAMTMRKWETAR